MAAPQERFAHRLRAAMREKYGPKAKATQLAQDTGLSDQTISRWLNAKGGVPTPPYLARLAPAFNIPLAEWLAVAGHVAPIETATGSYPEWGRWLRDALESAGRTPEWLATEMRLTAETLEKWLAGRSAPHSADVAIDIAHLLNGSTVAAVRAAGHPRTAALLEERVGALEDHPIIQMIRTDGELTLRQKERLIDEVLVRQRQEMKLFEARLSEEIYERRRTQSSRETVADDQAQAG